MVLLLCSDLNLWSKIAANPTRLSSGGIRYILLFSFSSLSRPPVSFIRAKMHAICQVKAFERMHSCRAIESGRDREMKV